MLFLCPKFSYKGNPTPLYRKEKGGLCMGKQLYIQTDNPDFNYAFWHKGNLIACCNEEDYKNTVSELSEQGYTFVNRV